MIYKDNIHNLSLEIDNKIVQEIQKKAFEALPNETGGFLVGKYSADNNTAIVSLVLTPVKIISGPTCFQRETEGMESVWDELYKEGLVYLGEWHSHPNGSSMYSVTDKKALTNIARSETVLINNPIMMIVSLSKKKINQMSAYYYNNGKIIEYERE